MKTYYIASSSLKESNHLEVSGWVDSQNTKDFFEAYKKLGRAVAEVFLKINPNFKYPKAFASRLIEMANGHLFFAKHLPRLTDVCILKDQSKEVENMFNYFTNRLLRKE